MKAAVEVNENNVADILKGTQPVLLDFWAEWCGPCKMIGPIIEELAVDNKGKAVIGKVDVDKNPKLSQTYAIRSIPTLLIFNKGEVVDKHVGSAEKSVLQGKIDKLL